MGQGVILAGGTASRLGPLTKVLNKHLLPVGDKPMLYHSLQLMHNIGVTDVVIILGGNSVGDVVNLIKDGSDFNLNVTYRYQAHAGGIPQAISLAKPALRQEPFFVLLGDNVFGQVPNKWHWITAPEETAWIVTTEVNNPNEYGQPIYQNSFIINVREKEIQNHNSIITGLYGFPYSVLDDIRNQKPSSRGELEIVDTIRPFLPYKIIEEKYNGFWGDCGTHEGLARANTYYWKEQENDEYSKRPNSVAIL